MGKNIKKDNNNVGAPFAGIYRRKDTTMPIKNIIIFVLAIGFIFMTVAFISNIINNNKNLDKIIYNAKKEAEQTLVSTGRVIYAEDVDNAIGASIARPLSDEKLPENTETTPQPEGTVVKPKENWNIETVTAVSVGGGSTVPMSSV